MIVAGLASSACTRSDPRYTPISSATRGDYDRWRMRASDTIQTVEWKEFDSMLQEFRFQIMANREATGADAIEASVRSKINGATFRDVIIMGLKAKLKRLTDEREPVRRVMNINAHKAEMFRKYGEASEFERARAEQEKRLLAIDQEVRDVKRRLADFGSY